MADGIATQRNHKDTVFHDLFSDRRNALSLYNAVNDTDYEDVFYNGREKAPDRQELKFSDAFLVPKEGYEWTAHVLNINGGGNQDLLKRCPALKGYVTLVEYIREYQGQGDGLPEGMEKAKDVALAIDRCIKEGVLREYLLKGKAEVKLMLLTEFDEEAFAETMREEGREEGEARVNQLYSRLVEEKRTNDLNRAIKDNGFRKELYKKYGL